MKKSNSSSSSMRPPSPPSRPPPRLAKVIDLAMYRHTKEIWESVKCATCKLSIPWRKDPKACPVGTPVCSLKCAKAHTLRVEKERG